MQKRRSLYTGGDLRSGQETAYFVSSNTTLTVCTSLAGGNRRRFSSHVLHSHHDGYRPLQVERLLADGDNPLHRVTDGLCIDRSTLRGVLDGFDARRVVEPVCLLDRERYAVGRFAAALDDGVKRLSQCIEPADLHGNRVRCLTA